MKLLLDQNLSWRLARALQDLFPDSVHVREIGLDRATDDEVWQMEFTPRRKDAKKCDQ